jgi:NAD(P)-dependent dehydrogenase (short-subunit alcohol dehydrogenase family)
VAAGNIKTPLGGGMSEQQLENLYSRLPIKRQGAPEDVAGAVLFLTSPLAAYITGQTLPVDGGFTISMYL